jgi:hypothetical protein
MSQPASRVNNIMTRRSAPGLMDGASTVVVYLFKFVRAMVFWIVLYVTEKFYQDAYVQRVLVEDHKPPKLMGLVGVALGAELAIMLMLGVILLLVKGKYKTRANTFVLDDALLRCIAVDYALSTVVIGVICVLLARAAESNRLFRYKDDGLRGIRALCNLVLYVSFVVLVMPFYKFV